MATNADAKHIADMIEGAHRLDSATLCRMRDTFGFTGTSSKSAILLTALCRENKYDELAALHRKISTFCTDKACICECLYKAYANKQWMLTDVLLSDFGYMLTKEDVLGPRGRPFIKVWEDGDASTIKKIYKHLATHLSHVSITAKDLRQLGVAPRACDPRNQPSSYIVSWLLKFGLTAADAAPYERAFTMYHKEWLDIEAKNYTWPVR